MPAITACSAPPPPASTAATAPRSRSGCSKARASSRPGRRRCDFTFQTAMTQKPSLRAKRKRRRKRGCRPGLEPGPITTGLGCCAKAVELSAEALAKAEQRLSKHLPRRRDERNCAHARGPGSRPGRQKTYVFAISRRNASESCQKLPPQEGVGNAGRTVHPPPRVQR